MRRRGVWRSRRGGGGANPLLERLRELKRLGLFDIRALGRVPALPEGIELGCGRFDDRSLAIVASNRDGLDLIGWAAVAALRAEEDQPPHEVMIAAPLLGARTRSAALRASSSGPALVLLSVPGLASASQEIFDLASRNGEEFEAPLDPSSPVVIRVARVVEGAAAVASSGGVRATSDGYAIYLRGERVGVIVRDGDGAAVTMLVPDRHRIHITEGNFARWGPDLHEMIVELAQDPRLLESDAAGRSRAFERAAGGVGARITARWIPWNHEGSDPLDWAGVDATGRATLGASGTSLELAGVPRLIAGLHLLEEERERWVPGSSGSTRLALTYDRVDSEARTLLGSALVEGEPGPVEEGLNELQEPRPRRGRRRSRRRRRGHTEEGDREDASRVPPELEGAEDESLSTADHAESESGLESGVDEEPAAEPEDGQGSNDSRRRSRGRRSRGRRGRPARTEALAAPAADPDTAEEGVEPQEEEVEPPEEEVERGPEAAHAGPDETEQSQSVDKEIEAALAEAEEPAAPEVEPGLRRRSRAAIIVCDEPDSILAALVLARERRSVVSFRVCPQDGLMDFFRGPATDIGENTDVLLVGFTCHPHPTDTLNSAELFRGRLRWFDHHEWAVEDLERLRRAISEEAVLIVEGAASPLAAVLATAERRSRFTDKLVELSARRLAEGDMEKWGYQVVGLLQKMAGKPGEYRNEISPLLSGKTGDLPSFDAVYREEAAWVKENDPRIVHFGEYQLAVVRVPNELDAGEVGRRVRMSTGARLSLSSREGEDLLLIGCNEEKRPINVLGLADHVGARVPWAQVKPGGDRLGRIRVAELDSHPERIETLIGEIVRNRSILYG